MFARKFDKQKYHPCLESLERKQLLSAGVPSTGIVPPAPVVALVAHQSQEVDIQPCGTGKGIIIITS